MSETQGEQRRAVVTGATGFTGGHLARTLKKRGYAVRALVRDRTSASAKALATDGIELVQGDVGDADAIDRAAEGQTHFFHIAAVYRSANHPDSYYFQINRNSVSYVLEAVKKHGVERVVHCSTCGVHGDVAEIPATEQTAFNPGDVYQRSKLAGEEIAKDAMSKGAPVSVVRPTGIYGPGDDRFLKLFRTIENGTFRMFGSGEIAYHMTYVDDMVQGLILAGEHPAAIGEVFLIGDDSYTTLNGLVNEVAATLGVSPPSMRLPVGPLMAAATVCEFACKPFGIDPPLHRRRVSFFTKARAFSVDKAKRLIGFQPQVPLSDGLVRTADWYREQGYLKKAAPSAA
ncbi:NAD(P)-dependent oxidoreductase [Actibacterium sp. 188UL27-1]|uniref:NAD-dependent epimerase/dehydratase family protein n=1 Tax=Actibacterium sp. 188UL27-1 TaxID=2786961 RepID=UPI00195BD3E6|nr:NAD-dependent epimerase/dehydratase family protein [Actibacterium sp. 188UL27-1]MBM7069094.1 NAD-dependent epimerase/dehydratase family protein [Actibacterium sp. 188UL27-1]